MWAVLGVQNFCELISGRDILKFFSACLHVWVGVFCCLKVNLEDVRDDNIFRDKSDQEKQYTANYKHCLRKREWLRRKHERLKSKNKLL